MGCGPGAGGPGAGLRDRRVLGQRRTPGPARNLGPQARHASRAIARQDSCRYTSGNNGGPPALPLAGWHNLKRCRAEPSGLREVYFRYDDELEYWARANTLIDQMEQYAGTKTYGFPVVVSALIDADGVVKAIRIVSDPRYDNQNRDEAYLLKNFLTARFGRDGWTCGILPLSRAKRRSTAISSRAIAASRSNRARSDALRRAICASPARTGSTRNRAARNNGPARKQRAVRIAGATIARTLFPLELRQDVIGDGLDLALGERRRMRIGRLVLADVGRQHAVAFGVLVGVTVEIDHLGARCAGVYVIY